MHFPHIWGIPKIQILIYQPYWLANSQEAMGCQVTANQANRRIRPVEKAANAYIFLLFKLSSKFLLKRSSIKQGQNEPLGCSQQLRSLNSQNIQKCCNAAATL